MPSFGPRHPLKRNGMAGRAVLVNPAALVAVVCGGEPLREAPCERVLWQDSLAALRIHEAPQPGIVLDLNVHRPDSQGAILGDESPLAVQLHTRKPITKLPYVGELRRDGEPAGRIDVDSLGANPHGRKPLTESPCEVEQGRNHELPAPGYEAILAVHIHDEQPWRLLGGQRRESEQGGPSFPQSVRAGRFYLATATAHSLACE